MTGVPEAADPIADAFDLRVVLVGPEPEFRKIPRSFTEVDPVSFTLATSRQQALVALGSGPVRIVVVDLLMSEPDVVSVICAARSAVVEHVVAVSRRDTPKLRHRAERIDVDAAVFRRRPGDTVVELIRNTLQYGIRRGPRAVMPNVISLNIAGTTFDAEGVNVATTGLLVLLPRPSRKGELANLAFDLPGLGHRIIATARVARSVRHEAGYLTGLDFEALSEADRAKVGNYVRRTIEPPDSRRDPLQRARQASRSSSVGMAGLRASVRSTTGTRCDHFRVRDLSEAGAFLYAKPPFEHPYRPGTQVSILFQTKGKSASVRGRVLRVALLGTLEGQLFPLGFAVEFASGGLGQDDAMLLARG